MMYKYKCGKEIINVFVWNDDFHKEVTVHDKKLYKRTIREDEHGKFFTWNRNKIYLSNWIRTSMKELKQKIDNDEWVTSEDLCQAIMSDGVRNVRFIVPMDVEVARLLDYLYIADSSKRKDTLCKIDERWNREVKQDYKIVLIPVYPDDKVVREEVYYTSDLIDLIKNGSIKIVLQSDLNEDKKRFVHQEQSNEDYLDGTMSI